MLNGGFVFLNQIFFMSKILFVIIFLFSCGVSAQIITIPDANFKQLLLAADTTNNVFEYHKIDTNNDGEIQQSEASVVFSLTVEAANISSLEGIRYFDNLSRLYCGYNSITSLDLTGLSHLNWIECYYNGMTSLVLQGCTELYDLRCHNNLLQTIDTSDSNMVNILNCHTNQLTYLNIENNPLGLFFNFGVNPDIELICADPNKLQIVQDMLDQYNYGNCVVSSDCSLGIENPIKQRYFVVYPNPVKNNLNIASNDATTIVSIAVYNVLGQKVYNFPVANTKFDLDVSSLKTGNYWVKIETEIGYSNIKFIKIE